MENKLHKTLNKSKMCVFRLYERARARLTRYNGMQIRVICVADGRKFIIRSLCVVLTAAWFTNRFCAMNERYIYICWDSLRSNCYNSRACIRLVFLGIVQLISRIITAEGSHSNLSNTNAFQSFIATRNYSYPNYNFQL